MRISDWSSDVCSSDLRNAGFDDEIAFAAQQQQMLEIVAPDQHEAAAAVDRRGLHHADALAAAPFAEPRLARQEAHDVIEQAQHDEKAAEGQGDVGITEAVHVTQDRKSTRLNSSH